MLNKITIHGYLGRDPELSEKEGKNGTYSQTVFSVGVSRDLGDETDWFRCYSYGKRAEVIDKYFSKGSEIIVEGRMESFTPKNDTTKKVWVLKVTDFNFCGSRGSKTDEAPEGFVEVDENFDLF